MIAVIRAAKLPIDSVTVIRHGNVVLDSRFGPFAEGRLGQPYASGRLHALQSATKSVSSMLLGIAMHERRRERRRRDDARAATRRRGRLPPKHIDARKRAMTVEDMLTMQSGLAWKESGYAYEPGSGNDVMAMLETGDWARYVIDRPMAARPGTSFVYNSGTAHLVSAAVSVLTRRPAAELAEQRLFAPLGIRDYEWLADPGRRDRRRVRPGAAAARPRQARLPLPAPRPLGRPPDRPAAWVTQSTTDHVADPLHDYGYLWWLDRADGYAYMAGLHGQLAAVIPRRTSSPWSRRTSRQPSTQPPSRAGCSRSTSSRPPPDETVAHRVGVRPACSRASRIPRNAQHHPAEPRAPPASVGASGTHRSRACGRLAQNRPAAPNAISARRVLAPIRPRLGMSAKRGASGGGGSRYSRRVISEAARSACPRPAKSSRTVGDSRQARRNPRGGWRRQRRRRRRCGARHGPRHHP